MREVVGIVKSKGRASGQFYNRELTMINHKSLSRNQTTKGDCWPIEAICQFKKEAQARMGAGAEGLLDHRKWTVMLSSSEGLFERASSNGRYDTLARGCPHKWEPLSSQNVGTHLGGWKPHRVWENRRHCPELGILQSI
jgi:hypothetical protein